LADTICPKIIIRASDQQKDEKPAVIPLQPYDNTANLNYIVCNSHEPILLRLLLCKSLKEKDDRNKCPFQDPPFSGHINNDATIRICNELRDKQFTQIYFRHEKIDKKARSCVVTFIQGDSLYRADILIERFKNTVEWLQIAEEKPFYHVIYYGDPQFDNDYTKALNELDKKMREVYADYSENEDICFILFADNKADNLRLHYTTIFSVKVQEKMPEHSVS